ncbi:hypothetical protein [Coralloluteibacterium thermophilus]|uniref:Uncharacterized protein n=1 Tax=Coralloluteibacterium thermophilum TaxID=2707049 RepID=A0ABV9NLY8_9GAMM
MSLLLNTLTFLRARELGRQARAIRASIDTLPQAARSEAAALAIREMQRAGQLQVPHFHGASDVQPYQPWTDVAAQATGKAQAGAVQLRVRGIAQWLTVVYYETRGSAQPRLAALHREVLGMLGELRGSYAAHAARDTLLEASAA